MSSGAVFLSANDVSPQANLGQTYVNFDLEGLLGPRAYVYVRNHDAAAWTKGLALRQRNDLFATEGSALTPDANTVIGEIKDASGWGAPLTTAGYIPDTLDRALYHHATQTTAAISYSGRVYRNSATVLYLEDLPDAAISNSGAYIVWKPYTFILCGVDDALAIGGISQAAVSAGYYGWAQYGGFMYAMLKGDGTANVDGAGNHPGGTAGFGEGVTIGTDEGLTYCYNLKDNAAASSYGPVMAACPYMVGL